MSGLSLVGLLKMLLGAGVGPAQRGVNITPGTPFALCRAINCQSAGTGVVTWADGSTSTHYFVQGETAIAITNIAAGGTATGFEALY